MQQKRLSLLNPISLKLSALNSPDFCQVAQGIRATHFYSCMGKWIVKVKHLAQEHRDNSMTPAKARNRTVRFKYYRNSHILLHSNPWLLYKGAIEMQLNLTG